MATHKINKNTVLNDEEYKRHVDSNWALLLFVLGAFSAGTIVHATFEELELLGLPKWIRFAAIVVSGLTVGVVLSKLSKYIRAIVSALFALAFICGIGYLIWINI